MKKIFEAKVIQVGPEAQNMIQDANQPPRHLFFLIQTQKPGLFVQALNQFF